MRAEAACPVCSATEIEVIYRVASAPVHQHELHGSRESAIACARGEIELALCTSCSFVFNRAFDPGLTRYSPGYDNTLTSSAVHSSYLQALARELVDRYDLHGKHLLEVGSGLRGDFLQLLCRLGPNEGIGFDPAYAGDGKGPVGVRFFREVYAGQPLERSPDFVCSRHTIEHVPRPAELTASIRRAVGGADGTPMFLETPDVGWILEEVAFWDVFYEHCSYFTPQSIRLLLAATGFRTVVVRRLWGDQFLGAEARAASVETIEVEPDQRILSLAEEFEGRCRDRCDAVRERLHGFADEDRTCVLWGAGAKGVTLLNSLGPDADLLRVVVDIYPGKQGCFTAGTGHEIVAPEALASIDSDVVLMTNPNYRDEIRVTLTELSVEAELVSVHD